MPKAMAQAPPAPPGSLAAALAAVPDPRRPYGRRPDYAPVPLVALLQATVVAVLCGARGQTAIAQWIAERREDDPGLLEALGFPPGRGTCVATLHRVYKALDVGAFERAVGGWLARTGVAPDDPLAVDGKTVRGAGGTRGPAGEYVPAVHLVAAHAHRAGAVLAQVRTAGKGHEVAGVTALLAVAPVAGRVVTGDALLTQRELCRQIVAAGGDYLLPVKENQPALRAALAETFSPVDPERRRRHRPTAPPTVVRGRAAAPGRPALGGDGAGAQDAPRTAGGAPAVGPGRSVRQPGRRHPG